MLILKKFMVKCKIPMAIILIIGIMVLCEALSSEGIFQCIYAQGSFSDVPASESYAQAVSRLYDLGIISGDNDGNFHPDSMMTRAEYAAIICRTLGLTMEAQNEQDSTKFTDVPSDYWASGFINVLSEKGMINGYEDNTFRPEDKITAEQAIKIIVSGLGYDSMAKARERYPIGYMIVAAQNGITNSINCNVNEYVPRSVIAQLIYNALEVPLMQIADSGNGNSQENSVSYVVMNGSNGTQRKTILSEYFNSNSTVDNKSADSTSAGVQSIDISGQRDGLNIVSFNGKEYIDYHEIQNKHKCVFINWIDVNDNVEKLRLFKNSEDTNDESKAVINSVPSTYIELKSGNKVLAIEYNYYINSILPVLN